MMINEKNIFEIGMLLSMRTGRFEGINKLAKDQLADLPKEIVRGTHDLFLKAFKDRLNAVISFDAKARDDVKRQCIPFPIEGLYFIKMEKVQDLLAYLDDKNAERDNMVNGIIEDYPQAKVDFANEYPAYYQRAKGKYLTVERLRQRYFFKYQFVKIGAPDENSVITPAQYKDELRKFKDTIDDMKNDVVATIYQELITRMKTLKEQCEGGKPNQMTFNALAKFLEKVDDLYLDFVDRKDMKDILIKIKAQFLGVDAETLRLKDDVKKDFRKVVAETMEEIKALPDIQLKRAIEF